MMDKSETTTMRDVVLIMDKKKNMGSHGLNDVVQTVVDGHGEA